MSDEQRDLMLRGILHDADRMDTIVRQLLDAARVMSGRFEAFEEVIDLADLVHQVADQLSRDPDHPAVRWSGEGGAVLADGARLKTTLLAFAEALVWWGAEGDIDVRADIEEGRLHLNASRTTPPIDPERLDAFFEARPPGSGGGSKIGLYVSRRVAEALGGRAWGEHVDGRLSFHLELPLEGPVRSAP